MSPDDQQAVSFDGVLAAAARIKNHVIRTPIIENDMLNDRTGARVFLKAEVLQHCGSFKARGAFNLLASLDESQRKRGVVAWSSGNHAQGVARAAAHFGCPAVIVMPADAPALKKEKVIALGAEIIEYDRYTDDREAIARPIVEQRGMTLAPSYDHPLIIEGQGTLGLEVADDLAAQGVTLDAFVTCCGGGGLTAGCATAFEARSPDAEIWIAEPEGYDETWRSIESGERQRADVACKTICDAIATPTPGDLTLPIMRRRVTAGAALSEREVAAAMLFAYKYLKLVVEPGGAVALAALLSGKFDTRGKTVGAVLSGGNVDPGLFVSLLGKYGEK